MDVIWRGGMLGVRGVQDGGKIEDRKKTGTTVIA